MLEPVSSPPCWRGRDQPATRQCTGWAASGALQCTATPSLTPVTAATLVTVRSAGLVLLLSSGNCFYCAERNRGRVAPKILIRIGCRQKYHLYLYQSNLLLSSEHKTQQRSAGGMFTVLCCGLSAINPTVFTNI